MARFIFYLLYGFGGMLISIFLPAYMVYPFGMLIAWTTTWAWNVLQKEVRNG